MSGQAFFVTSGKALFVANDGGNVRRFAATPRLLPAGIQVAARRNAEMTIYYVEDGTFEFMVDGATSFVTSGNFVRVDAGVHHAYRNVGNSAARLLTRTLPADASLAGLQLVIEVAAA